MAVMIVVGSRVGIDAVILRCREWKTLLAFPHGARSRTQSRRSHNGLRGAVDFGSRLGGQRRLRGGRRRHLRSRILQGRELAVSSAECGFFGCGQPLLRGGYHKAGGCCDSDLHPETIEARMCRFECTFCATCAETVFGGVCPNCQGELVRRPAAMPAKYSAATECHLRAQPPRRLTIFGGCAGSAASIAI
jgi:uncharacterized protein